MVYLIRCFCCSVLFELIRCYSALFRLISRTTHTCQTPKATIEVKDLRVDLSKTSELKPTLFVKLQILPILVNMGEYQLCYDEPSSFNQGGCVSSDQASFTGMDRGSAPFVCEEILISCGIAHDRELGVQICNLDVTCREVTLSLNEDLLAKKKTASKDFTKEGGGATSDQGTSINAQKKQNAILSIKKYTSVLPEKVSFNLPKLNVMIMHRAQNLVVENNIVGINLRSGKSHSNEDGVESTCFDVQMDFSEIHLLREGSSSILEIVKLAVVSSTYIPTQPTAAIRSETDVNFGGTQFNIIMTRLTPWMRLHLSKKKKMVLRDKKTTSEKPQETETKAVMWTCTVSAPDMTIMLYSISGSPLYRGRSQSSNLSANNVGNTRAAVHGEIVELHLHMVDHFQECLKESSSALETNSGSLLRIEKVSMDWGKKETESHDVHTGRCTLAHG